jgi:serine/threonine protein kinase
MALAVGSRLGHYDVTALIGEGGMGQVYQATDTKAAIAEGLLRHRATLPARISTRRCP